MMKSVVTGTETSKPITPGVRVVLTTELKKFKNQARKVELRHRSLSLNALCANMRDMFSPSQKNGTRIVRVRRARRWDLIRL